MDEGSGRDLVRQAANVVGALFQAGMTAYSGTRIQEVVDSGPRSLVEPAGYAFTIWALIFALSLAYAGYQALPTNRESPLLRRVGWFTATAFFLTGMWSVLVPLRHLLFAQAMLLGVFACLLVAYVRLARSERGVLSRADRWLVALQLGPFLGWVTAANAVSLTSEAVRLGLVGSGAPARLSWAPSCRSSEARWPRPWYCSGARARRKATWLMASRCSGPWWE